jgi:hypothetical protein
MVALFFISIFPLHLTKYVPISEFIVSGFLEFRAPLFTVRVGKYVVSDNEGVGSDEEKEASIFESFSQSVYLELLILGIIHLN